MTRGVPPAIDGITLAAPREPVTLKHPRLACFLYILMRDYLPCGTVEKIMLKHAELESTPVHLASYSNEHLARYAAELSARLQDRAPEEG